MSFNQYRLTATGSTRRNSRRPYKSAKTVNDYRCAIHDTNVRMRNQPSRLCWMGVPLTHHLLTVESLETISAVLVVGLSIICASSKHILQNSMHTKGLGMVMKRFGCLRFLPSSPENTIEVHKIKAPSSDPPARSFYGHV